jgi:hypothetical protein
MDREEIDAVICKIMHHDGPDMHVDGHEVITDFVMALLKKRGEGWAAEYDNVIAGRKRR